MTQQGWQKGVGGWVYKLQATEGATKAELSVLFEQGKMGLPNGMCWNMVRNMTCRRRMSVLLTCWSAPGGCLDQADHRGEMSPFDISAG